MLSVDSISVEIQSVQILRDLSFEVPEGAMVGLIGRNGAGKTTTMRAITGLVRASKGSVRIDGRNILDLPPHKRVQLGIGYMPEDRRLIPQLTVEENILLPAWTGRRTGTDQLLARIYDLMPEVGALRQRKALLLSGGQQKLVALARALVAGERLLILDEPFEGVAPALVERLTAVLADLKRDKGRTVLVSDSSLNHGGALYDGFAIIERGQISETSGPAPAESE